MITSFILLIFCNLFTDPEFRVENTLSLARAEVVSIPFERIKKWYPSNFNSELIAVFDQDTKEQVPIQWVDFDQNGEVEELLIWIEIKGNQSKNYIVTQNKKSSIPDSSFTYVRFVPERIDDIAWENDKVAFRTYGPEAQRLTEDKKPGGTLTSGIDAWLKRVNYPIIDKWYQKYVEGGSYHSDSGEGYDPYHVGASRGLGGIGVWMDDSLYVSKNFINYKILANGPLRSSFELTYAPWSAGKTTIQETKRISIDKGSQLFFVEEIIKSDHPITNLTTGITLHDGSGQINSEVNEGWISYWEKIDDSELGTGIIASPENILDLKEIRTVSKEQSHIYLLLNPDKKIEYYAGFGWSKAGEFTSADQWNNYLQNFAEKIRSPLIITYN